MSDTQARCTATETSVCNEGTLLAQVTRFNVRCRIKHLLHTWTTLRSLVYNDNHITRLDSTAEDTLNGSLLRIENLGLSAETPDALINTGRLYHTAILGYVTKEYCKTTILCICILKRTYATLLPVGIKNFVNRTVRTHCIAEHIGRCSTVDTLRLAVNALTSDAVSCNVLTECSTIDTNYCRIEQTTLGKFAHDTYDTTGTAAILH